MQTPSNFKMFYKNNVKLMSMNYPFLSRSQINARLRSKWKKIGEESKQTSQGKRGSFKTQNVDFSAKACSKNDEICQVSFWKPAERNQTFAGRVFRPYHNVPEVKFDEKISKTSILKKHSSPAQKCKAGQVSFSSDVTKESYDLSDDQKDENVHGKINNTSSSSVVNNEFSSKQGICNQMDYYDEPNHLFHKTSNIQVGKDKQKHIYSEIHTKQSLNKLKQKESFETERETDTFSDKLALKNKQYLYCEKKNPTHREVSKNSANLDKLDSPISDKEIFSEDENFYNFEEDDEDAVLLIRRDNSCTPALKKDYDTTEFNDETVNNSVVKTSMTLLLNKDKTTVSRNNDSQQSLEFTPKCHSVISRRDSDSQKVEEKNNSLPNKLKKAETKSAKMTKQKDITSLLEEDIESKMERFFSGGIISSHEDSHAEIKVQKSWKKRLNCRYSVENGANFSGVAETRKNKKNGHASSDTDNPSPDSLETREETPESFFYSQQDAEETEAFEERRPIINQMFEDPETRTSNSVFIPAGKRLLTSNEFQTSSNFGTMLFEDNEIFLQ